MPEEGRGVGPNTTAVVADLLAENALHRLRAAKACSAWLTGTTRVGWGRLRQSAGSG